MPKPASNRVRLTARFVDSFVCPPGGQRVSIHDEVLSGLELRVTPSGSKSFVVRYTPEGGTQRRMTLGQWPHLTVDQARRLAREKLGEVASGGNPMDDRRALQAALSVKELCAAYVRDYAKPHKKSWQRDERRLAKHVLPALGTMRAVDVTRADVATLHRRLGEGAPSEANRVHEIVRKMFNWAAAEGLLPVDHVNPAKQIKRYREKPRERYVKPDELKTLVAAIEDESDPAHRAFFMGLLLTGCRRSELLNARWDDILSAVDGSKVLRLEDTKNGDSRNVPLPGAVVELLKSIPRHADNPYVFASTAKEGVPMDVPRKAWDRIRVTAKLSDVHLHDLRATVGTLMAAAGESAFHIKKVLGHKSDAAVKVYIRLGEDAAREALDRHANRMAAILGGGE